MVEAAIWLLVQGDRAGAEDLLAQVLRIDPTHERAREAMKSAGAPTSPGTVPPQPPVPDRTIAVVPPGTVRVPDTNSTPLEPLPALQRDVPPGLMRRSTIPGMGTPDEEVEGELPFVSTPSSLLEKKEERTDRHLSLVVPETPKAMVSSTHPALEAVQRPTDSHKVPGRPWAMEVLTGPNAGTRIAVNKRPIFIGKGQGLLDVEADLFMSPGHASFFLRGGELWLSDGGSPSGSWLSIDGPVRLTPGESFSVGLQRLRYLGPLETVPAEQPWPYGAPRPAASWRLEHVLVGARPGRTWILRGVVSVGRDGTMVRFPEDDSMAPLHCELRPAGTALEVMDKSGDIGTFVLVPSGGERKVNEGMRVRLGGTVFRVGAR